MKILSYRDLNSKDGLLPLLDHAFNWVFNQQQFENTIKIDPRLKDGPISFCAVEDGRIIGHVGVLDLATRTLEGKVEYVGGLYGVATLPGYTRRGVSTALMNNAHQYFEEKDYRFSFLATSPALIAHEFYKKLGYVDLIEYPSAYKAVKDKKARYSKKEKVAKLDLDRILEIYNEFSKDKTGFVIRDIPYLKMLKKVEGITSRQCMILDRGYVVFREDKSGIGVRELVALDTAEMHMLINLMEERTRGVVYDRAVLNSALRDVYRSRGYMIQDRGYGLMMFKPLTTDASFEQIYGDRFHLSRLDVF
jgi:GNAT superfamily N-acetyltransferase